MTESACYPSFKALSEEGMQGRGSSYHHIITGRSAFGGPISNSRQGRAQEKEPTRG